MNRCVTARVWRPRHFSRIRLTALALIVGVSGSSILTARIAAARFQVGKSEPAQAALKIVVLEGEDAINVVRQKTAVVPLIEVRDRNDQPVAGVVVRFAIRSGKATFSGSRTLTVTTNAAGRATATGLTPTGTGAVQIGASATFQGQTAAVTIAQSNVMTAAQAAAGSASGASGGAGANASGAAAGGSGGGISGTTLSVVGAAAAGGVVATAKVLNRGDNGSVYSGSFSGQSVDVLTPNGSCALSVAHSGTVSVQIQVADSGAVSGTGEVQGTMTIVAGSPGCPTGTALAPINSTQTHGCCNPAPVVNGPRGSLTFSGNHPGNAGTTWFYDFSGALSDPDITGTFTLTTTYSNVPPSTRVFPVRLSKNGQ